MHHDRGVHIVNRVLVVCSMCLSGYFGWVIGEGAFPLNVVLAALCASVAYGVSLMFERAAIYNIHGFRGNAVTCWVIGAFFLFANTMFDYSSAAAVRDAVATQATNMNNKASDVRGQIDILRKNIADAKATTAWQTQLQPAEAYEGVIRNLESNQTIMRRSKNCADQTLPDTKAHCQSITDAKANLAMAQQKKVYEGQIAKWEAALVAMTAKADETGFHSNPALAQVKAVASWFKLDRNLNDNNIFWGQNSIMLLMTILVNLGLAFLGNEIGIMRARTIPAEAFSYHAPPPQEPRRLAYYGAPPPEPQTNTFRPQPPSQPPPSGHHTTHNETIILAEAAPPAPLKPDPAIDELLRRSRESSDAVRARLAALKPQGSA